MVGCLVPVDLEVVDVEDDGLVVGYRTFWMFGCLELMVQLTQIYFETREIDSAQAFFSEKTNTNILWNRWVLKKLNVLMIYL